MCFQNVIDFKYQGISERVILEGVSKFDEHRAQPFSPSCIIAVSQIQYSCQLLADSLQESLSAASKIDINFFVNEIMNTELNDDESYTGPFWYFLRVIVKKHGMSTLFKALECSKFERIKNHEIFDNVSSLFIL